MTTFACLVECEDMIAVVFRHRRTSLSFMQCVFTANAIHRRKVNDTLWRFGLVECLLSQSYPIRSMNLTKAQAFVNGDYQTNYLVMEPAVQWNRVSKMGYLENSENSNTNISIPS